MQGKLKKKFYRPKAKYYEKVIPSTILSYGLLYDILLVPLYDCQTKTHWRKHVIQLFVFSQGKVVESQVKPRKNVNSNS